MAPSAATRHALSALVVGLGIGLAAGVSAQTTGTAGSSSTAGSSKATAKAAARNPDHAFVEHAALGGMAEVELGNLAKTRAASDEVKQFAQRMVDDHGKANEALKQVASAKGIDLPTALDRKHRADIDRLGKLSGAEFDRAYMSHMVDDHRKDVDDFRKESKSGKDADVKAFAASTLPTLEEHLKLAQSTNDRVKKRK